MKIDFVKFIKDFDDKESGYDVCLFKVCDGYLVTLYNKALQCHFSSEHFSTFESAEIFAKGWRNHYK